MRNDVPSNGRPVPRRPAPRAAALNFKLRSQTNAPGESELTGRQRR